MGIFGTSKKAPEQTLPAETPVVRVDDTPHLGEGKLLRLAKVITLPAHEGDKTINDLFKEKSSIDLSKPGEKVGKKIEFDRVDSNLFHHFGGVKTKKLLPAEIPVWTVASRTAKYRPISVAICTDLPEDAQDPATALARFYQTIQRVVDYREAEILDPMNGIPNFLHVRSPLEECAGDPMHALLWYVTRISYGEASIAVEMRPVRWHAVCPIGSHIFGGSVPVPVEAPEATPVAEPAIA